MKEITEKYFESGDKGMVKLRRILVGMMACAMLLSGGAAMAASGQHEVTASRLYFRSEASTSGETIASLSRGTVVTVLSTSGGWAKARWNGQVGYLSCEWLDEVNGSEKAGSNVTKLSGNAWMAKNSALYERADGSSDEIAALVKGDKLSLKGETLNFYYVKVNGQYGYVFKNRVTAEQTAKEKSASSSSSSESASSASRSSSGVLRLGDEGSAVKALQTRLAELGYMKEKYITGYFGEITDGAVRKFQTREGLDVDGAAGPATMKKLSSAKASSGYEVVEMEWFDSDVSRLVAKRGGTAYIIDCRTGTKIKIRRVGGSNHMDVEPATASDTEKLLKIYGGEWSWDQRPVILIADGKYIAASINGMPHGDEISTDNNFDGQFCLHTTGSMTHGTEKVNSRHQNCIEEALDYFS